jgi:ABC-type antimicrobial peptide transport system permease subunit
MLRLAYRQLLLDLTRTILVSVALAAVIAVILVLDGFEKGQYYQLARAVMNRQADLFVVQAGVSNLLAVRSSLPQLSREKVESVAGVRIAHPLTAKPVIYERHGVKTPIHLFVYDTMGGPAHLLEGDVPQRGKTIVIDTALAQKYDLGLGDTLTISDFDFTIAGISEKSAALFMPFAFINYDGMIDFMLESEIAPDLSTFPLLSFLLVELEPDAQLDIAARRIEDRVAAADVYTVEQMARNDVNLGRTLLGPVMGLLVSVAYIIGLLVVGLIMFAEVRSRLRSFGVLKALGFRHTHLALTMVQHALLLLLLSIPIGMVIAQGIAGFIHVAAPVYLVEVIEPRTLTGTLGACVVFTVLGALLPLRVICRTDPLIAFSEV